MTDKIWHDISEDSLEVRQSLIEKLNLSELQRRILIENRWLPQAVEGGDWLMIKAEIPSIERRNVHWQGLTILLSKNKVITLHRDELDSEVAERVEAYRPGALSPSLIAATMIQFTVEQYMPILNSIDDVTDQLEDTMIRDPGKHQLQQLFVYKRQLADLRKVILPLMNMLNGLSNGRYGIFDEKCAIYARDSYDYAWRVHELIDTMRDLLTSALDMYLSVVSNRMNDVMKRLTIVTTIFMPMSFLTGLAGMNFSQLPFHSDVMFWITMALLVVLPILMLVYFIRSKWL